MFIQNKNTLVISEKQMLLAFKKCYLLAVKVVLSFFEVAKTKEEKRFWENELEKWGQSYTLVKDHEKRQIAETETKETLQLKSKAENEVNNPPLSKGQ
jgi:hypothetical protein